MNNKWYLDSGCSRHMIGNIENFTSIERKNGGDVTFGDNAKGKVTDIGKIGNSHCTTSIDDVLLVDGLKHNLLVLFNCVTKAIK